MGPAHARPKGTFRLASVAVVSALVALMAHVGYAHANPNPTPATGGTLSTTSGPDSTADAAAGETSDPATSEDPAGPNAGDPAATTDPTDGSGTTGTDPAATTDPSTATSDSGEPTDPTGENSSQSDPTSTTTSSSTTTQPAKPKPGSKRPAPPATAPESTAPSPTSPATPPGDESTPVTQPAVEIPAPLPPESSQTDEVRVADGIPFSLAGPQSNDWYGTVRNDILPEIAPLSALGPHAVPAWWPSLPSQSLDSQMITQGSSPVVFLVAPDGRRILVTGHLQPTTAKPDSRPAPRPTPPDLPRRQPGSYPASSPAPPGGSAQDPLLALVLLAVALALAKIADTRGRLFEAVRRWERPLALHPDRPG
jgi:hypothetical protein